MGRSCIILVLTLFVGLSACATSGPILIGNIRYEPPQGMESAKPRALVAVGMFKDQRGVSASLLGKRRLPSADVENELVVQGTAADIVNSALKQALGARGFTVKDAPDWDLSAEGIPDTGDFIIAGEIKAMGIDVESRPLSVSYKADVQLRLIVADARQKKLIRTLNLSSRLERQDIAFSFSTAENMLSEVISSAIDRMFSDEEIKKILQ